MLTVFSNVMEFATYTGIPKELLMTASRLLRESQLPVEPGSDITGYDAHDKLLDVIFVAYHLGFFSFQQKVYNIQICNKKVKYMK